MKAALLCALLMLAAPPKKPDVEAPGKFWERLGTPRNGEWLDVYDEEGQTFSEYKAADPIRATRGRNRIYLLPLLTRPPQDPRLLQRLSTVLEAFYGKSTAVLPPRPLPRRAYAAKRRQFSISKLVPTLLKTLPADALCLLAITDRDLYIGDMGYTYGWGSFQMRVGIMSTGRLRRSTDETGWKRRLLSLAIHETGHMLSMRHCVFYRCVMNGARTLGEADRRPVLLCPVCRSKVCWNLDLRPISRYAALAAGLRRAGLPAEAVEAERAAAVTAGKSDS